jgi:hypothetical protein
VWLLILVAGILFFNILALVGWNYNKSMTIENLILISIILSVAISIYVVGWFAIKAPHAYRRLREWDEDYLESAYILIFDTTLPKGTSTGEKIFNLAKFVFPELRPELYISPLDKPTFGSFVKALFGNLSKKSRRNDNSIQEDIAKSVNYKIDSLLLDVAYKTEKGYFVVKDFKDKIVTLEDLKELTKSVQQHFRHIFRVLCIARQYDGSLQGESLEHSILTELKTDIPIDLLLEEKVGYSVLWIS